MIVHTIFQTHPTITNTLHLNELLTLEDTLLLRIDIT